MFRLTPVVKNLLIINTLMFLATFVFERMGIDLSNLLGLHFFMTPYFKIYQLITYMFMHGGFTHLFFNMFALWMFGTIIESTWGPKKFLFYYISCGVGAGLIQELVQLVEFYNVVSSSVSVTSIGVLSAAAEQLGSALINWMTVGASGAVYAILLAFGMLYPEERLFIFPLPIPIKAKWFVLIYIAIELVSALGSSGDGVAHFAHLGGMLFGFLMIRYWSKHPYSGNGYGTSKGGDFFESMKKNWEKHTHKNADSIYGGNGNKDWEYNAKQKEKQEEIDRILDKIRKSGYDSLTEEEKKKLFDNSNKK